ncbi:hypothetical protein TI04_05850 [Achromatium sp. WMS2]|nr:hypothetical protein TI04_05850 [Achromatium sp. WMS2]
MHTMAVMSMLMLRVMAVRIVAIAMMMVMTMGVVGIMSMAFVLIMPIISIMFMVRSMGGGLMRGLRLMFSGIMASILGTVVCYLG